MTNVLLYFKFQHYISTVMTIIIIDMMFANVVDYLVSEEQTTFIKGRQILDGPLMLSDIISWSKKMEKQLMIFKSDFEKVYDSLSWDYLDRVLKKFGFGEVWRG